MVSQSINTTLKRERKSGQEGGNSLKLNKRNLICTAIAALCAKGGDTVIKMERFPNIRPIARYYSHLVVVRGRCNYQLQACGYAGFHILLLAWKYTQWNVSLFVSSDKCPYWTNPYHMGFRYESSLNFHTYFGQCPNDTYILLHMPLHACPNYPHTGLTTATAPSGHQMAVVTWDRCIGSLWGGKLSAKVSDGVSP